MAAVSATRALPLSRASSRAAQAPQHRVASSHRPLDAAGSARQPATARRAAATARRRQPRPLRTAAAASAAGGAAAADVEVDVCVLGAGIIGLCTALTLLRADPQLRVAVVDRKEPCAGATGAGQGYIWLAHREVGSPLYQMAVLSKQMWGELLAPAVPQLTADAVEWQPVGSMLIASSLQESQELQRRRDALLEAGLTDLQLLTAAEARQLEPALRLEDIGGSALLVPSDLQVSGRATAAALLQACQAHGGRFTALFQEGAKELLSGPSGRVDGVKTAARRVRAPRGIVVALGAWTGSFLAQQMADVRWAAAFRPRRGLLLEMGRPEGMAGLAHGLMEMGYSKHYSTSSSSSGSAGSSSAGGGSEEELDITFTATTSACGTLLVGSSREFAGYGSDAPEEVVDAIMQRAVTFLPGLAGVRRGDISVRAGPRPYATAGRPMVGFAPGVEGLFVAAGHEGSGLTLAPATAELAAAYLLDLPSRLGEEVIEAVKSPFRLTVAEDDWEGYLSM